MILVSLFDQQMHVISHLEFVCFWRHGQRRTQTILLFFSIRLIDIVESDLPTANVLPIRKKIWIYF